MGKEHTKSYHEGLRAICSSMATHVSYERVDETDVDSCREERITRDNIINKSCGDTINGTNWRNLGMMNVTHEIKLQKNLEGK